MEQYKSLDDAAYQHPVLAAGDVKIWYRKGPPSGHRMLDPIKLVELTATHTLIGEVQGDADLERVFDALQCVEQSPLGRFVLSQDGVQHCAMTVGDVIQKSNGKLFAVSILSFIEIPQ